ncbi:hypothetical protein D1872_284540 [compost metagenome]
MIDFRHRYGHIVLDRIFLVADDGFQQSVGDILRILGPDFLNQPLDPQFLIHRVPRCVIHAVGHHNQCIAGIQLHGHQIHLNILDDADRQIAGRDRDHLVSAFNEAWGGTDFQKGGPCRILID